MIATPARSAAKVMDTRKGTLRSFGREHANPGATLCADEHGSHAGMPEFADEAVNHSVSEHVRRQTHANGMESSGPAMLKRAHDGTFHKMGPKHLQRYVDEFAGKHDIRDSRILGRVDRLTRA